MADRFFDNFVDAARDSGYSVELAAAGADAHERLAQTYDALWSAPWSRNPMNVIRQLRGLVFIRHLLGKRNYTIVHTHSLVASLLVRLAARSLRQKSRPIVLYTAHGFEYSWQSPRSARRTLGKLVEKVATPWTDHIVVMNREDTLFARAQLGAGSFTTYIPGVGFDRDHWSRVAAGSASRTRCRSDMGVPDGAFVVLTVAEFTRRKRHGDCIGAFERFLARNSEVDARLWLVGEGRLRRRIERQVRRHRELASRVVFLGHRDDVRELMNSSDALLHLSEREGLPMAVIEALSMGLPVVGYSVKGMVDLLGSGIGLLNDLGDVQRACRSLESVMRREIQLLPERVEPLLESLSSIAITTSYSSLYQQLSSGSGGVFIDPSPPPAER